MPDEMMRDGDMEWTATPEEFLAVKWLGGKNRFENLRVEDDEGESEAQKAEELAAEEPSWEDATEEEMAEHFHVV